MKSIIISLLIFLPISSSFAQTDNFLGIWFVEEKVAGSDLDIPLRIVFTRYSKTFQSKTMVDSMYCTEQFSFLTDSNFNVSGECLANDPKENWSNSYGSYGVWRFKTRSTILMDYYVGMSEFHCRFKVRYKNGKMIFVRKKMKIERFESSDDGNQ